MAKIFIALFWAKIAGSAVVLVWFFFFYKLSEAWRTKEKKKVCGIVAH